MSFILPILYASHNDDTRDRIFKAYLSNGFQTRRDTNVINKKVSRASLEVASMKLIVNVGGASELGSPHIFNKIINYKVY